MRLCVYAGQRYDIRRAIQVGTSLWLGKEARNNHIIIVHTHGIPINQLTTSLHANRRFTFFNLL